MQIYFQTTNCFFLSTFANETKNTEQLVIHLETHISI